ncbi:ABC transporter substrate-binding protein [Actinophytocola sp.]|uniref:ABC transporter substrate-binding protein n=1 Tax=Actinophytocola sp. TaxID=1872138 RepID=UPI0038997E8C
MMVLTVVLASACSTAVDGTPVADPRATRVGQPGGPVRISFMTSVGDGYEDLLTEYQSQHRGVTIELQKVQPDAYYAKLHTMLAAGQAPDVVVVGEEYRATLFDQPDLFADLAEVGPADVDPKQWPDWKYEGGLGKDGTWFGYGMDSGPLGMAYRTDLFAAAGLPTDPAQVGNLFRSWDSYLAAGDQYVRATGKPWFDSAAEVFTARQNQLDTGYYDRDDNLIIENNADIKASWDAVTGAVGRGQSARLAPFSAEWFNGFRAAAFATAPAPYWMLALIKTNAGPENAGKWAVADTFPGGGANWGGSYLAVPRQSHAAAQAAAFAAWLTAPEQQVRLFRTTGSFPSRVGALRSSELRGTTDPYFATKETGRRYADLAGKVTVAPYRAPRDSRVQTEAVWPALQAVEQGTPPDAGWQQAVDKARSVN